MAPPSTGGGELLGAEAVGARYRARGVALLIAALLVLAAALAPPRAAAGKIYWISDGGIGRANLDGTHVNPDFITDASASYSYDVAVSARHVYWPSSWDNTIARATLDGTHVNPSFITSADSPAGVAVDSSHVYWTNTSDGGIGRANLDGTHVNPDFITDAGASYSYDVAVQR